MTKPIQGLKKPKTMEIKLKTLKFDADQKLVAFIEKKVSRLGKFSDEEGVAEVTLSLLNEHPQNKQVKIQIHIKGDVLVIERQAERFEDAVTECVDAMKEKLTRAKEKKLDK